jgi:hypothetical protein
VFVATWRGPDHRRRFALQLCMLRTHGRFPDDYRQAPVKIINHLSRQLALPPVLALVVLDEDDGPAILTRRLLTDHPFLKQDGVAKVFTKNGEDGELKLAGGNVAQTDKKAFTTIINLYEIVRYMCFDLRKEKSLAMRSCKG